jgi:hypothetical protein
MTSRTWGSGSVIDSAWLQDTNDKVYGASYNKTTTPTLTIVANVIIPTLPLNFLGAGLVKTITPPSSIVTGSGCITLIPTAAFTTDTTGNIALASTAVINKALSFFYDVSTAKWYPSY